MIETDTHISQLRLITPACHLSPLCRLPPVSLPVHIPVPLTTLKAFRKLLSSIPPHGPSNLPPFAVPGKPTGTAANDSHAWQSQPARVPHLQDTKKEMRRAEGSLQGWLLRDLLEVEHRVLGLGSFPPRLVLGAFSPVLVPLLYETDPPHRMRRDSAPSRKVSSAKSP
jgi:hypothetical protein